MTLRVLHLTGSPTSDFYADLSHLYATGCLQATADPERYEFHIADVLPDGRWRFPSDLEDDALKAAPTLSFTDAMAHLDTLGIDVVVPQLFCLAGMTSYRALLDVLRLPFVGNPAHVMSLGAHKARARAAVAAAGVDVPRGEVLRRGERPTIAPPAVVKPADADNSLGVTLVRQQEDYAAALDTAFAHSDEVLVETYVELGREVRCGIIESGGRLVGLPLEEYAVDRETKPIRDHADKLRRVSTGGLSLVAKDADHAWVVGPNDPLTETVWSVAKRCHRAMGCRDYSLFDFRVDEQGRPWFLEASLYSSFSPQSVISVMALAAGTPLTDLFADLLATAVTRHRV